MWLTWLPSLQFCAVQKGWEILKKQQQRRVILLYNFKMSLKYTKFLVFSWHDFFAQPVLVGHGMITKVERHVRHNLSPTAYPPDTSTFVGLLLQLPPQWNFKNGSIALRIKLNHYFNCCTTCPTFHISVSWNNCYCWLVGMGELCSDVNLFASLVFQPWHPTHCWLPFLL